MECPVVKLSGFVLDRVLHRAPPSLHQNLPWTLFFLVPDPRFGTRLFKSFHLLFLHHILVNFFYMEGLLDLFSSAR